MERPQITRYNKERSAINSAVTKTPVQGHYKLRHLAERQTPINFGTDNTGFIPSFALMFPSYIWQKSPLELADRKEEDTGSIVLLMEND